MSVWMINVLSILVTVLACVNAWFFLHMFRSYEKMTRDAKEANLLLHMEIFRIMINGSFPITGDADEEIESFRLWRYN